MPSISRPWKNCAISLSSVKVFGDSLQDSGTFGYKFTLQAAENPIYVERVAANYGQTLCNFYIFTGTTFAANPKAGCTNFAIGGGRITYTGAGASPANPLNIGVQMATYASLGSYAASDLVIIDGGQSGDARFLDFVPEGGVVFVEGFRVAQRDLIRASGRRFAAANVRFVNWHRLADGGECWGGAYWVYKFEPGISDRFVLGLKHFWRGLAVTKRRKLKKAWNWLTGRTLSKLL